MWRSGEEGRGVQIDKGSDSPLPLPKGWDFGGGRASGIIERGLWESLFLPPGRERVLCRGTKGLESR